jgi:hypothetical protein
MQKHCNEIFYSPPNPRLFKFTFDDLNAVHNYLLKGIIKDTEVEGDAENRFGVSSEIQTFKRKAINSEMM